MEVSINILILRDIKGDIITRILKILLTFSVLISCEKDDICIEGSENTNRVTIGFIDNESKNPTGINLSFIKGVNNDSIISEEFSGAELKLPLMVNSNQTKYILEQNEVRDTLIIFHQTNHLYLNRSCGFKSNFLIKSDTEIIKESGWIREISIVQDSIFNEEKTNIFIHY
mgnify:FL=1|tara:strand:+ start:40 stop:552 length:513 start_codon:yes stop_codon:yes gene_type:complete